MTKPTELPISGEIENLIERLRCPSLRGSMSSEAMRYVEAMARTMDEAATALSILQREVVVAGEAMKSALAHRYGDWTTILEDALLQQKEGCGNG